MIGRKEMSQKIDRVRNVAVVDGLWSHLRSTIIINKVLENGKCFSNRLVGTTRVDHTAGQESSKGRWCSIRTHNCIPELRTKDTPQEICQWASYGNSLREWK
jgi:hypothetical protein